MRKTIVECDKCSKVISGDGRPMFVYLNNEETQYDLCDDCFNNLQKCISKWFDKHPQKDSAEPEDDQSTKKHKVKIDWPKVIALRNAGWSFKDIADEMNTTEGTIKANIYKHM